MFNQKLKTQRIAIFGAVLLALITLSVVLTTCEGMSSMGFGDPIDFEAPVLKLDRYPNPYYVKSTITISGTATDNVAVDKVVCRYLDTDINEYRILGTATISGDRFSITINFTDDDNNRKISAEVVAWDKMGNSDEGSIDFITFIVDTSPPVFKEPYIQRALSRSAPLRDFNDLTGLNHRNIQHTDLIQNGSFWIKAEVIEDETMAKSIQLFLFDADNDEDGKQIYAEEFENKNNPFSPEWTIHEHNIIERGNAKGYDYSGKVARGEPIYLRVSMVAYDLANNHGEWDKKQEDFGWFVIDRRADVPKALLAGGIADIIPPGTEIPLDVFDDDTIDEVYIDLIKIEQWFGIQGADDAAKWETLRQKFASGEEVLNWDNQPITNRRTMAAPPESMTVSVKTGTTTAACGEYMLVGFVKDKKGAPHEPPHDTPVWGELTHKITIADQNSALIVIDTVVCENGNCGNPLHLGHDTRTGASTGNSPEESTFPKLGDGRYFTISGYTLNESSDQQAGYVSEFKIAWIPYAIIDAQGVATSVDAVKAAMENKASYPEGVQHWSFDRQIGSPPAGANSYFIDGSSQDIAGVNYTKQTFKKQFDILGGNDDIHGVGGSGANRGYKYFTYNDGNNDKFENEDKYFVLYAKNNNGNITYRTIRLLGNKNPPALKVYDFTNVIELDGITDTNPTHHYTTIRNFARDVSGNIKPEMENYVAKPFTAYPIGKVYKLYIVADADHGVEITGLDMFDSTDGTKIRVGNINTANNDITFVMKLDENELKVFNFEAGNALDVHASAMRTLAVTNTAQLVDITTALADGEYGRNDTITLRAEFSSPVMVWSSSAARPHLNIRYETKGRNSGITDPTSWAYASIPYTGELNDSSGAVQFQFQVPANANGRLQTLHLGNSNGTTFSGDRPINLSGARIVDSLREEDVFLPGNGETGYPLVWNTDERSLQHTKNILLDGIAPYVTTIIIHNGEAGDDEGEKDDYLLDRGKPPPFTGGTAYSKWYYYNREDTVYLEIIANKTIRTVGLPRLQFQTRNPNGNLQATLRYADYVRPTDRGLLFAVSAASIPDNGNGIIVQLTLPNDPVNRITDLVGNTMVNNPTGQTSFTNLFINMNVALVIDTVVPAGVLPRLDVDAQNNPLEVPHPEAFYSKNPVLKFANSNGTSAVTTDFISTGTENWGTFMEYSLDGGTSWYVLNQTVTNDDRRPVGATAVGGELALSSGEYDLVTRQRDKAGNISVESLVYKVQVEADFPNLIGINVRQPRGIYSSTEGKNVLEFSLDFSRAVYTAASPNAHIVISDWERNTLDTNMVTGEGNYAFRVNVVPITRANASSTLWFRVTLTENQIYMPTGITITRIDLAGVMDEYGNSGNTKVGTTEAVGTGGTTFQIRRYDVANAGPPVTYHTFEFQTGNYVHNLNGRQHEVLTWKPVLVEPDCLPRSVSKAGDTAATVLGTDNTPSSRQSITLKFSHDIYKEVGKIYLRPYGSFPVPPVFPFDRTTAADGSLTPSFSDVYNSPNIDTARMCTHGFNIDIDRCTNTPTSCNTLETPALLTNEQLRDYLQMRTFVRNSDGRRMHQRTTTAYQVYDYATRTGTGGDSAATILGTDSQGKLLTTGLDYGPYKLTTQGLVEGRGYAADSTVTSAYNSDSNTSKHLTSSNPGWNPVATFNGSPFMVPDTSSKYVLDYQYSANATTDAVNNIRTALRAAKYRWQEIDVTSSRVTIAGDRRTVTISLEHPLPVGMRWELQFDEGVFVDRAENKVAPLSAGDHWFWTAGVQAPVIRVNRKSLDYRTIPDRRILQGNYQAPPNDTGYNAATNPGNKNATNLDGFNYAHFRMESETPGAAITYTTLLGKSQLTTDTIRTHEFGAIEPAWTGDITTGNAWQRWGGNAGDTGTDTWGTWILPNLVRRAISGLTRNLNDTVVLNTNAPYEGLEYTVTRDGLTSVMQGFGNFWGHRSHNRDATKSQLDGLTGFAAAPADLEGMINISGNTTGNNTLPQGRASKNYVVAQASITNGGGTSTAKGYEGIFKSVLVVNETNNDANKIFTGKNGNVQLYGGTSTSASSIAGFPLLLDTDDVRYGKFPCGRTGDKSRDLIWITTEIVSSYYIRLGSNQNMGGQGSAVSGRTFSVCGDAGYTISGSYGDLSYTWKQETYGTNQ